MADPNETAPDTPNTPPAADPNPSGDTWLSSLGDDLKGNERLQGFKSVGDLANAFVNMKTAPEIPESKDGYKLPADLKIKGLKTLAHENGISQNQLDAILKYNSDINLANLQAISDHRKSKSAELKETWGEKFETRTTRASEVVNRFDKDGDLGKFLKSTNMADNPKILRFLNRIGREVGEMEAKLGQEGGFIPSASNVKKTAKSPAEVLFPKHAK